MRNHCFIIGHTFFLLGLFIFAFAFSAVLTSPCAAASSVKIQLCMVIDGSSSINSTEWSLIVQAVAKGVRETIAHDSSIELTIVQFGYSSPTYAKIEMQPTVITNADYAELAENVTRIVQGNDGTPMAHGLYLAWNSIKSSNNFHIAVRQIINLATDGEPNLRNNNATSDLDSSGGPPNAHDDVIAVVNGAINQRARS
jgi:Mg-chelatase subunit ChlD